MTGRSLAIGRGEGHSTPGSRLAAWARGWLKYHLGSAEVGMEHEHEYMARALASLTTTLDEAALFAAAARPFPLELGPRPRAPEELAAAMRAAAEALPRITCDFQAGRLAMLCGTLVEGGAPTRCIAPAVATRARDMFRRARALITAVDPEEDGIDDVRPHYAARPADVRAYLGAQFIGLAAMTMLCRDKPARVAARRLAGFADDADAVQHEISSGYYLSELLRCVDDFTLTVIHVTAGRGYRVDVEGVRCCFQLFTLLQGALIGDPAQGWLEGQEVDRALLAYARGQSSWCAAEGDQARWHYSQWYGWGPDGLRQSPLAASVWGEARLDEIATFEGAPTILLAPPVLGSRGWGASFLGALHDAHRVRVEVTARLSPEEVARALERMAARAEPGA